MGPEEERLPRDLAMQCAAELQVLASRVDTLEAELAQLRSVLPSGSTLPASASARSFRSSSISGPSSNLGANSKPSRGPAKPSVSLEDRLGSQLFSRIGIVALLVAAALFLKLAVDSHWIGPIGRVLIGLIAGAALILWSGRFRSRGFDTFSYALKATGSGALYLSLWAAFQLYHLLPATVALAAMVLVTAWNAYMAWSQNSEVLALYALAGAFAAPLLLATGGNHEVFLFCYLLAVDIATVTLVRLKPWPRLLLGAFPATVAFFSAWYLDWYGQFVLIDQFVITIVFIALFFITFLSLSIDLPRPPPDTNPSIRRVLLPLANAAFASLALYSVLQDAGHHDLLPWIAVAFAAFYLGIMRLPQPGTTSAVHMALAVLFLTVAIPLKTSGHSITIGWLAEGAALLWASYRLATRNAEDTSAPSHRLLRRLAAASLTLGLLSLLLQPFLQTALYLHQTPFFNGFFAAALFSLAALATAAWLGLHAPHDSKRAFPSWMEIAAASIIAFNLIAILATIREFNLLWFNHGAGDPQADLQRCLAISSFLMLYGAALLATGFWKRSAFIRWQALLLIVLTIAKVFLYDLRNLSQGYRVLSILGLGALLMAVSFAYQKDWLSLRNSQPLTPPSTPYEEENQ